MNEARVRVNPQAANVIPEVLVYEIESYISARVDRWMAEKDLEFQRKLFSIEERLTRRMEAEAALLEKKVNEMLRASMELRLRT